MRINNPSKIAVLMAGLTATSVAVADQVIADDLIVQGSQCVGIDCVNGESFGFDTIRLKENNLRIKFDDTSASSAFPNVDWQLTANESANGGLNKFSIEDTTNSRVPFTVEASTPNNSLYVDSTGNVGLGTSTPILNVHAADSDTPAMRLEQNASGGFTPQTWDIAGNEANFFVRDVTGGSRLPFRIKPGAPTDSMTIAADGDIGLGTSSPSSASGADRLLEVKAAGSTAISLDYNGTNKFGELLFEENDVAMWSFGAVANSDFFYIYNYSRNQNDVVVSNTTGYMGLDGVTNPTNPIQHSSGAVLTAAGVWQNASSRSLKRDIQPLSSSSATMALMSLEPVRYRYNADPDDEVVGFIAEDVPDLVATESRKTLSSMDIVAVMAKVMQEQQTTIEALKKDIELLKKDRLKPSRHPR